MKDKIWLSSPHMSEEGFERTYVQEAFDTNWVAPLGPLVTRFEAAMGEFLSIESSRCLALSSGTSAIHLALKLLGVGPGDKVFCSSLTFAASCNPIAYLGAEPVFIDSEPMSYNMCPEALKRAFEQHQPKAVVIVHLYGQSADMAPIQALCQHYQVPIVEDAAESLGATYRGTYTGLLGDLGIFSFNGNKIITTSGGGMLIAQPQQIQKALFWATQAREQAAHYEHREIGYNYRLSNVSAGIGLGQMQVLTQRIAKKKAIYEMYQTAFQSSSVLKMMTIMDYGESNYWLSVATLADDCGFEPKALIDFLASHNIESRAFWKPMHLQPVFAECSYVTREDHHDVSGHLFNRGICLPSDTKMTVEQQQRVISLIQDFITAQSQSSR